MKKQEIPEEFVDEPLKKDKANYFAYFLLFFPTLVIAAIPSTIGEHTIALTFAIKILLVFYQFVVIKNFVDKYYGN